MFVRSGIWTHALCWGPEFTRLDRRQVRTWVWRLRPLGHPDIFDDDGISEIFLDMCLLFVSISCIYIFTYDVYNKYIDFSMERCSFLIFQQLQNVLLLGKSKFFNVWYVHYFSLDYIAFYLLKENYSVNRIYSTANIYNDSIVS